MLCVVGCHSVLCFLCDVCFHILCLVLCVMCNVFSPVFVCCALRVMGCVLCVVCCVLCVEC